MIQKSVDFALRNRFLVLAVGILLLIWGAFSFQVSAGGGVSRRCQ